MERGAASVTMQQNEPLDLSCFNNSLSLFPSETSSQNVGKRTICEGIRPSVNSSHRPPEISKVKFLTALELTPVSLKANAHDVPLFGYAVNDACTLGGTRRSLLLRLDDIRPYTSIYWSILAHHNIQPRWTAVNSGAALAEAGKRGKSDDVDMPLDLSVKKLKLELGGSSKSVSKPAVRQKQKRYRTEKPFECKHCTARFTLRSNMIRHMKQQHAEIRKTHLEIAEFLKEQNDLMSDWSREISLGEFGDTPFPMPSSYYFNSRDGDDDDDDVDFIGKEQFVASKKKSAYSTAPNRVSCPYCSREFPWNSSLRRHILTHTGQKPFKCDSCPLLFTTKSNCDRHSSRKHTESRRKTSSNKSSESGDNLGSEHESSQDTQDEEMRGHSETPFKCYLCDSAFPDRQQALDHLKDSHALDYASLLPKGATTACFNSYSSDSADENHERASSTTTAPLVDKKCKRKVICSLCRRRFWSTEDLRRHMRTHTGERPFSCELCSRRFTLKHSMIRHVKKHQSGFKK